MNIITNILLSQATLLYCMSLYIQGNKSEKYTIYYTEKDLKPYYEQSSLMVYKFRHPQQIIREMKEICRVLEEEMYDYTEYRYYSISKK